VSKSIEESVNLIRAWLIEVSMEVSDYQTHSHGGAPELQGAVNKLDDVISEFERLVEAVSGYEESESDA
jgi:hypothetical protein